MKSYTDLGQSRKLTVFLSLESADKYYYKNRNNEFVQFPHLNNEYESMVDRNIVYNDDFIPCWSLVALLSVLPNGIVMNKDSQMVDIIFLLNI